MKRIVFTGGGSAGHVTPNLAIIPKLTERGWSVEYIGSETGIEKKIIEEAGIPYHGIASGKLRRYFDLQNLKDPFKVLKGIAQSYRLLKQIKPQVVFSKGGFVAVPVVLASRLLRIPVIIHESDMSPGLANKISIPFAKKVCVTFPETLQHFAKNKAVHTGSPIREAILHGDPAKGRRICDFHSAKPVLLIMGGSLGSERLNKAIRSILDLLLKQFQIVHLCGKGHVDPEYSHPGYKQFEYINEEMPDVLAMADLTVSRAGANSIFEFLALRKPNVLIPLSRQASRGDQILNAQSFEKLGFSKVVFEEDLTSSSLLEAIQFVHDHREQFIAKMGQSRLNNSVDDIVNIIEAEANAQF